jgi:KDO2-lipid IV(A) lauroyltransferase
LVSTKEFKRQMTELMKMQHVMCLVADQNPGLPENGYWLPFFGRLTPFIPGPEKAAVKNNPAIFFMYFHKTKRGCYDLRVSNCIENPNQYTAEQLVIMFRDFLEGVIRQQPEIYLWSHRRWKYSYDEKYKNKLIEKL